MAKCKNCGAENANPRKTWKMAGRPDKAGKKTQLTIGLFDCSSCGKSFKVVLNKQKI
jgi:transcription elongation factor Elf1